MVLCVTLCLAPRLATSLPASSSQAVARKTSLTVPSVSPARRSRSTSPLSEQDVEEGGSGSEDDTSLDGDCDLVSICLTHLPKLNMAHVYHFSESLLEK